MHKYILPHHKYSKSVKEEASFAPRCIKVRKGGNVEAIC